VLKMRAELSDKADRLQALANPPDDVGNLLERAHNLNRSEDKPDYLSLFHWLDDYARLQLPTAPPPKPGPAVTAPPAEIIGEATELTSSSLSSQQEEQALQIERDLAEANSLLGNGDFDQARQKAKHVLTLSPNHSAALDFLKRTDKEEETQKHREQLDLLRRQAIEALQRQDFPEARTLAEQARQLDPTDTQAEELIQRIQTAEQEAEKNRQSAELIAQAQQAQNAQDFDGAIALLNNALQINPQDNRAAALLKDWSQAQEERKKKNEFSAELALARQAFLRGELDAAETGANQALTILPQHPAGIELLDHIAQARQQAIQDQIDEFLKQGHQALSQSNFELARNFARQALAIDSEWAPAAELIRQVHAAEQKQLQDKLAELHQQGRTALANHDFEQAAAQADRMLELDDGNRNARSLRKAIEKARREAEKAKKRRPAPEPAPPPPVESTGDETWIMPARDETPAGKPHSRWLLWLVISLIVIGSAIALYWSVLRPRFQTSEQIAEQLAAAQTSLSEHRYDRAAEIAQQILSLDPGNSQAATILNQAQARGQQADFDTLLLEAQTLRGQNLLPEADLVLQKILDIDPAHAAALDVRAQIEAEISASQSQQEQEASILKWLKRAKSFLTSGRLAQARSEIAKVAKLRPDQPELPALRKQLRQAEEMAKKEQQALAEQKARIAENRRQATQGFQQGEYKTARKAMEQWLSDVPEDPQAKALQSQWRQAESSIAAYQKALTEKRYDQALAALSRLQQVNPADPNISALRRQTEDRKNSARARVSIYRLSEAAELTLDDRKIGSDGVVENQAFPIGRHSLAMQNHLGQKTALTVDLIDGRDYEFVYDATIPELRPLLPADRAGVAQRKTIEQVHRFRVEHPHGFLRGSCHGALMISGIRVEYQTTETDHNFQWTFKGLKCSIHDDRIEFIPPDNRKETFRISGEQAKEIKLLWDRLQELTR